jgi:hypothetical protein
VVRRLSGVPREDCDPRRARRLTYAFLTPILFRQADGPSPWPGGGRGGSLGLGFVLDVGFARMGGVSDYSE